jgi:hypothetical protein
MTKVLCALLLVALSACASSSRQVAVQLPGEPARSGLQVPPDAGERPVQIATAPAR